MLRRTAIAGLLASALSSCASLPPARPGRARAFDLAVDALAWSADAESPAGIVAALAPDRVCPGADVARRVRCHMSRPTVEVSPRPIRAGWLFVVTLPELSDHVHRARVWSRADGTLAVQVESEN